MRIAGRSTATMGIQTVAIPRGEDAPVVFKIAPILSFEDFDQLCPRPEAPFITKPGEQPVRNPEDATYKKNLAAWSEKRYSWMFVKSLTVTPELTFDKVKLDDPDTWHLLDDELKEFGLSDLERSYLYNKIIVTCGMSQDKIEEATKSFLTQAMQRVKE